MQIMVRDAYAFGDDGEEEYDGPSKSEVKRQLLALQDLGKHRRNTKNSLAERLVFFVLHTPPTE